MFLHSSTGGGGNTRGGGYSHILAMYMYCRYVPLDRVLFLRFSFFK